MEPLKEKKLAMELLNERRSKVKRAVQQLKMENAEDAHRLGFLYASANRYNIFPSGHRGSDADFFRKVVYHERMALEERKILAQLSPVIQLKGTEHIHENDKQGVIFCTYHTGSFFSPLYLFASMGLDVTACIATKAFVRLKDSVEVDIRKLCAEGGYQCNIELLDVGSPTAPFQMVRRVKKGKNLLIYVDASFQDKEKTTAARSMVVNMLHGKLLVKKGAAALAYLSKCPIIPLVSQYDREGAISLRILPPISPNKNEAENAFAERATTKLFSILEQRLFKKPEEWEGWLYCHNMVFLNDDATSSANGKPSSSPSYMFDTERFSGYRTKGKYYLFDKETYRFISLSKDVYLSLMGKDSRRGAIAAGIMDSLIKNGVLIRVVSQS